MGHERATEGTSGRAAGLRERKKAETRGAISGAAARLAMERGLENVRVADIAADVGVSPRTYNNYFSSIPEAICAAAKDRALALADAVRDRPRDEPLDQAIANAMLSSQDDIGLSKPLVTMIIHTPALRGEFFKAAMARDAALAQVIAERTGTHPGDLYPQVLAAAVSSAARVATHHWLHDDTADYARLLRAALSMVAPMARAMPGGSPGTARAMPEGSPGTARAMPEGSPGQPPRPLTAKSIDQTRPSIQDCKEPDDPSLPQGGNRRAFTRPATADMKHPPRRENADRCC